MNTEDLLFWWEDRPRWIRRAAYAALALAVYGAGFLFVVQPTRQARGEAARQVEQLRARLEERRQRLASYQPPERDLAAELSRLRGALAGDSAPRGADFGSTLLTRLSRHAEAAGVSSPIFNPAGVDTLLAPLGPDSGGLRAFTVEGQFDADTEVLANFLARVGTLSAHAFVDTLSVRSALPEHRVYVRFRFLDPAGDVARDTVRQPAAGDPAGGRSTSGAGRGGDDAR